MAVGSALLPAVPGRPGSAVSPGTPDCQKEVSVTKRRPHTQHLIVLADETVGGVTPTTGIMVRLVTKQTYQTLADLREQAYGFQRHFVSRRSGIEETRLAAIEAGEPASVWELEELASVYGVDEESLAETPIELQSGGELQLLTLRDEFHELSSSTRLRIIAAASAAKDLVSLRRLAGEPAPLDQHARQSTPLPTSRRWPHLPHQQGKVRAEQFRRRLRLGSRPIHSLRDLVARALPHVAVLYADLGDDGVAGLSLVGRTHGPSIVLNLTGKNRHPTVRRFSLAHELCHILVDWGRRAGLAEVSRYVTGRELDVEQRANAFAARLLCPRGVVEAALREGSVMDTVALMIRDYGVSYPSARLSMKYIANETVPHQPPPNMPIERYTQKWIEAERPAGIDEFPLAEVAPERRTLVARYASALYSTGVIGRGELATFLKVSPLSDLEAVLDYFSMDSPEELD